MYLWVLVLNQYHYLVECLERGLRGVPRLLCGVVLVGNIHVRLFILRVSHQMLRNVNALTTIHAAYSCGVIITNLECTNSIYIYAQLWSDQYQH